MVTPVSPLRTRLIHISSSFWKIYRSLEIILKWELSIRLEFKSSFMQIHCFQKHQSEMNYMKKSYVGVCQSLIPDMGHLLPVSFIYIYIMLIKHAKDSDYSLVSNKNLRQGIGSYVWGPGRNDHDQKGLHLSHL